MHQNIVEFLLEIPPLDEIGGRIAHIIEQYRAGIIPKGLCIDKILKEHQHFLHEYVTVSDFIKSQII